MSFAKLFKARNWSALKFDDAKPDINFAILQYLGFFNDEPDNAITRLALNLPVKNNVPIITKSCGVTVQTTSPLLTGSTLLISVPTFPAG